MVVVLVVVLINCVGVEVMVVFEFGDEFGGSFCWDFINCWGGM